MLLAVGAQAGEGADALAEGNVSHGDGGLLAHLGEACCRGADAVLVADVLGGGADEEVSGRGAGHEDALP